MESSYSQSEAAGSSIWSIMFSKWPMKDPANNEGVKGKEEMNMTAQWAAETAEHRLSRD